MKPQTRLDELFEMTPAQADKAIYGMQYNQLLRDSGYTDLGWLNDSSAPAHKYNHDTFTEVFRNDTGSWCINVDKEQKLFYCVDMGD